MNEIRQSETVCVPSVDATAPALVQAAKVACAYLVATQQERKNNAYLVFSELARNTAARAGQGLSTSFTAINLKAGVAPDAAKEPSGWLSPLWSRLTEDEPQWQEGLIETARMLGASYVPRLAKVPGSPALYALEAIPIPPIEQPGPIEPTPAGGVRYTAAAVAAPAAWLNSALRNGVVRWTVGVRWTLLGGILAMTFATLAWLWLTINWGLRAIRPISLGDVTTLLIVAGACLALVQLYRFLDALFELRIVMAPSFLTSIADDNVTLEFRRGTPDDEVGELAFVRYTSICPCGGVVVIDSGRAAFPDRLVGRCRRSAREHVFSFDPVSRLGRPLVAQP